MDSFISSLLIISAIGAASSLLLSAASFLMPPKRRGHEAEGSPSESSARESGAAKDPDARGAKSPRRTSVRKDPQKTSDGNNAGKKISNK